MRGLRNTTNGRHNNTGKGMEIIEQGITPKSKTAKTEDGIVITDDFVVVIDGSTSKTPTRISRWRTNGRYCMKLVSRYIRHAPKDIDAAKFCLGVTEYVRRHYSKAQLERTTAHPEERLTASCAVFSRLQRQVWLIGDCQCLIGDRFIDNPKPSEGRIAEERAGVARRLIAEGMTERQLLADDKARKAILPSLVSSMKGQNVDYAVIDGFSIPMGKVRIETLDFRPWTIVLASDGYPFLLPTLAESEAALARQLAADPLNIGAFKATKGCLEGNNSFDDRAYVRFRV